MKLKDFIILLVIFLVSLVPRKDLFYSTPGNHHESVNAHLLITHHIWQQGQASLFSPRYSYDHDNDRRMAVFGGVQDAKGNFYYVSYPPGVFVFSNLWLQCFPGYMGLRCLSVLIHFITALAFFVFLAMVFKKTIHRPVLYLAVAFYIFSTGNLWIYSYFFFSDTLVLFFLFMASVFLLRLLSQEKTNKKTLSAYLLFFAMASFTDWLSFFYGFSAALFILLQKDLSFSRKRNLVLLTGACFCIVVGSSYWVYSGIEGMDALTAALKNKLAVRSGFADTGELWYHSNFFTGTSHAQYINVFLKNHLLLFQFTALFLLVFAVAFFTRKKQPVSTEEQPKTSFRPIVFLLILPTILHYAVFTNFSIIHEFSQIKFSLILCACCPALLTFIFHRFFAPASKVPVMIVVTLFLFFAPISISYLGGLVQSKPNHSANIQMLSTAIQKNCLQHDLIFVNMHFYAEVAFNTKRFYLPVKNLEEAQNITRERKSVSAIYIYPDSTGKHLLHQWIK